MPNADDFREELYKPIFSIQASVEVLMPGRLGSLVLHTGRDHFGMAARASSRQVISSIFC